MNLPENYPDDNNLFYRRKCYRYCTMKNSLEKIEQQTEQQTEALRARLDAIDTICKKMLMYLRQVHAHNKVVGQIINLFFLKKVFCKKKQISQKKAGRSNQMCRNAHDEISVGCSYGQTRFWNDLPYICRFDSAKSHYHASCYKNYTVKRIIALRVKWLKISKTHNWNLLQKLLRTLRTNWIYSAIHWYFVKRLHVKPPAGNEKINMDLTHKKHWKYI